MVIVSHNHKPGSKLSEPVMCNNRLIPGSKLAKSTRRLNCLQLPVNSLLSCQHTVPRHYKGGHYNKYSHYTKRKVQHTYTALPPASNNCTSTHTTTCTDACTLHAQAISSLTTYTTRLLPTAHRLLQL
jgi:hypothetical protein